MVSWHLHSLWRWHNDNAERYLDAGIVPTIEIEVKANEQLCHVSIDQSDKDPKWTIMAAAALIKEYCKETGLDPAMAAGHIARMLEKKHD